MDIHSPNFKLSKKDNPLHDSQVASKVPWPLRITACLMGISAAKDVLVGSVFLIMFGFGFKILNLPVILLVFVLLLPLILAVILFTVGILTIKYARGIWKMQKSAYTISLVLIMWGLTTTGFGLVRSDRSSIFLLGLLFCLVYTYSAWTIYYYREKFVN